MSQGHNQSELEKAAGPQIAGDCLAFMSSCVSGQG